MPGNGLGALVHLGDRGEGAGVRIVCTGGGPVGVGKGLVAAEAAPEFPGQVRHAQQDDRGRGTVAGRIVDGGHHQQDQTQPHRRERHGRLYRQRAEQGAGVPAGRVRTVECVGADLHAGWSGVGELVCNYRGLVRLGCIEDDVARSPRRQSRPVRCRGSRQHQVAAHGQQDPGEQDRDGQSQDAPDPGDAGRREVLELKHPVGEPQDQAPDQQTREAVDDGEHAQSGPAARRTGGPALFACAHENS